MWQLTPRNGCFWSVGLAGMVLSIGLVMAILGGVKQARAQDPLVLAVHPYLSSAELLRRFSPLATHLADALGRPVKISVSPDYESHIAQIGTGAVDLAYLGPSAYVTLSTAHGPQRLLARLSVKGMPVFHGYVVAHSNGSIKALGDLKGKRFAFGDESSTMSHMVPYALMLEAGVAKKDLSAHAFVGSHKNVALAVLAGAFDAGGVKEEIYHAYKGKGLRALAKSPPVSEHLFVASKRVSAQTADSVRTVMLSLADDATGRNVLKSIKGTVDGLVVVQDADYDPLRRMMSSVRGGS